MTCKGSTVLMVPPEGFCFNYETSTSNSFQSFMSIKDISTKALAEFTAMVLQLEKEEIKVLTLSQRQDLPDAVFPNNWFSTHIDTKGNNILIIYPLLAKNRQAEVNIKGLITALNQAQFEVNELIDLRNDKGEILEGTGSLVLDRENLLLYASLSPRTSLNLVNKVADILGYTPIVFNSVDRQNKPVYHTNVIMGLGKHYAIICLDSINDAQQKTILSKSFKETGKIIIDISWNQAQHMCGNVLELYNKKGESLLILSEQAKRHFTHEQLRIIQQYSKLISTDIPTIEAIGGGSARCMMAEIFY
ncbi:TPA: arginine deiminase-related protein [Legionella pneumophila]